MTLIETGERVRVVRPTTLSVWGVGDTGVVRHVVSAPRGGVLFYVCDLTGKDRLRIIALRPHEVERG